MLPRLVVDAGPVAVARFLEFFAARIANRRTRAAYGRAVGHFLAWCEARGLAPRRSRRCTWRPTSGPPRVGAHRQAAPGDWLVVSQVLAVNPAASVLLCMQRRPQRVHLVWSPAGEGRAGDARDTHTTPAEAL